MEDKHLKKLEDSIMSEIKSGKIRLRSKYLFLADKLGLESAFVLSAILSILFFNLVLFYLKSTDNLAYLGFGASGILAFLESFPYLLIIGFIFFLFLAGYLMAKADFSYKRPFKYFAISLMAIVMIFGAVLAYTDMSERIEEQAFSDGLSGAILKPFLDRAVGLHRNGLSGKIAEVGEDYLVMEIPRGLQKVDLQNLKSEQKLKLEKDQFIVAVGERKDDIFVVSQIRIVAENEMSMIRRGIHRRQMHKCDDQCPRKNGFIIENEEMKKCMDDCFKLGEHRRGCFDSCNKY